MPKVHEGYIVEADSFWRPAYRISPFNTSYVATNKLIADKGIIDLESISKRLGKEIAFTENGRAAIRLALQHYHLQPNDEVYITTTSGNGYISSCVTGEIEKICKWSMQLSDRTKLIFINHEFGFMHANSQQLQHLGLPIIEDKALSFSSGSNTAPIGDFVIYSLPKYFPVCIGGILQGAGKKINHDLHSADPSLQEYLQTMLSHYLQEEKEINQARLGNHAYLMQHFQNLGATSFIKADEQNIPGVFMFSIKGIDLPGLKIFMQNNGIESSVFYGREAFYLPVHQNLSKQDLDFFYLLTKEFITHGA